MRKNILHEYTKSLVHHLPKNGRAEKIATDLVTEIVTEKIKQDDPNWALIRQEMAHISPYKRESFKLATDWIIEMKKRGDDWFVVHGIIFKNGRWVLHAWTEKGKNVLDPLLDEECSKREYKTKWQAVGIRYTHDECCFMLDKTRTYGPWDKELKKLK